MNAPSVAIERVEQPGALARQQDLGPSVEQLLDRVEKVREVSSRVMKEGVHYGKIPGTKDKDALLKPGAEILCLAFGLAASFDADERWDGEHLEVVVTCTLTQPSGVVAGDAIGSCTTKESKYAYRQGRRTCPECGSETALLKSKKEPEWFCWVKKDGCGKTFKLTDERITSQKVGRVPNPDLPDMYNTVRKMACKRAHVAAALFVTGASELFTQDVEEQAPRRGHDDAPEDFYPDEGSEGTPPVGRAGPRDYKDRHDRPAAPPAARSATSPVQGVPTSQDLEQAIEEIRACRTVEALEAFAKVARTKRWSKTQAEALKQAHLDRHAVLTDPDLKPPPEGDDDQIPF